MLGYLLAPLRDTLRPHFNLSKTRLATMAIILFGLANGRTVNLSHLASQFPGKALHASNYRRLQHFFKQVQFDEAVVARFIVSLLNIKGPMILAVDRDQLETWESRHQYSGSGHCYTSVQGSIDMFVF